MLSIEIAYAMFRFNQTIIYKCAIYIIVLVQPTTLRDLFESFKLQRFAVCLFVVPLEPSQISPSIYLDTICKRLRILMIACQRKRERQRETNALVACRVANQFMIFNFLCHLTVN